MEDKSVFINTGRAYISNIQNTLINGKSHSIYRTLHKPGKCISQVQYILFSFLLKNVKSMKYTLEIGDEWEKRETRGMAQLRNEYAILRALPGILVVPSITRSIWRIVWKLFISMFVWRITRRDMDVGKQTKIYFFITDISESERYVCVRMEWIYMCNLLYLREYCRRRIWVVTFFDRRQEINTLNFVSLLDLRVWYGSFFFSEIVRVFQFFAFCFFVFRWVIGYFTEVRSWFSVWDVNNLS